MSDINRPQARAAGTGRLPENVVPPNAAPKAPPPPPAPARPRDVNGTKPLARHVLKESGPLPKVDIESLNLPEEAPKKGWFGRLVDKAGDVVERGLDKVGDAADAVIDAGGQVAGAALDMVGEGQAADRVRAKADRIGDAANRAIDGAGAGVNDALDAASEGPVALAGRLADGVIGPERPEYKGQIGGFTGAIANRLGAGDSVFLSVDGGAKVGVGAFAGAELSGTAMLSRGPEGEIMLSLTVGGKVEGGLSTKTGFSVNGHGADAEAAASLNAGAQVKLNLRFDPSNPDDVKRLQALLEPDMGDVAEALTSLNPLALASPGGSALDQAIEHNYRSHEVGGTVGAKAGASVETQLGPVKARLGADAFAVGGTTNKYSRDGSVEQKLFFTAGAVGVASGRVGGTGAETRGSGSYMSSLSIKTDASGRIIGLSGDTITTTGLSAGGSHGNKTRHADGTSTSQDGSAGIGEMNIAKVERSLTEAGMAAAERLMAAGASPLDAYRELVDDPGMFEANLVTIESDTVTLGGRMGVGVAGVQLGLSARATLGKSHMDSQRLTDQDLEDLNLMTGRYG